MPRPIKCRKVCSLPDNNIYGPIGTEKESLKTINMTIDEYETIRLIDYEGLNQEECATQMNVARTTAQRIYNNARSKLSISLIEGKTILIEGGDYILCDESKFDGKCNKCCKRRKS